MDFKKKDRSYKAYAPLSEKIKDFETLEVSVGYSKGGMNYFSGGYNKRGYRLLFKPCTVANGMISCVFMSANRKEEGYYILIEEAARYKDSRLTEIANRIQPFIEKITEAYLKDDIETLKAIAYNQVVETVGV